MVFDIIEPAERPISTRITSLFLLVSIIISTPLYSNVLSQMTIPSTFDDPYIIRDELIDCWRESIITTKGNDSVPTVEIIPTMRMEDNATMNTSSSLSFDISKYQKMVSRVIDISEYQSRLFQIRETLTKNIQIKNISEEHHESIPTEMENIITQNESIPAIASYSGDGPNFFDLTRPSGLSGSEINSIIEDQITRSGISKANALMYGKGDWIAEIENKYNVNALQMIATSCTESGYGSSRECHVTNNPFGIMTSQSKLRRFQSIEHAIESWAGLMRTYYLDQGLITIDQINSKYAPGNYLWGSVMKNKLIGYSNRYQQNKTVVQIDATQDGLN